MSIGCYIIGEDTIHQSITDISSSTFSATEDYIFLFKEACKKLKTTLKCLVIVDSLRSNELNDVHEIYKLAKEYANFVYIITPIVALLQNVLSSIYCEKELKYNKITVIIFIVSSFGIINCILRKTDNNLFEVDCLNSGSTLSPQFQHLPLSTSSIFCFYNESAKKVHLNRIYNFLPNIIKKSFNDPLKALALGGIQKALCKVEPGKYFEIRNFTPGIIINQEIALETCKTFPITVRYSSCNISQIKIQYIRTLQVSIKIYQGIFKSLKLIKKLLHTSINNSSPINYLIKYDEFGLLTIEKTYSPPFSSLINHNFVFTDKFVIWSDEIQELIIYDFGRNSTQICKISDEFKNVKNKEDFENVEKNIRALSGNFQALTILFNGNKSEYKINESNIFIIPSYIALLEYCIQSLHPNTSKLIIIVTTKIEKKFYVLSKEESGAYLVKYFETISQTFVSRDILCGQTDIAIIHLTETHPSTPLLFFDKTVNPFLKRLKISDSQETIFQGALKFSTLYFQSMQILSLPYLTFDPQKNNIIFDDDNEQWKIKASKYYEIEAVFFQLLSTANKKNDMFWGDLITILIPKNDKIFVYFFAKMYQKYLLHDFITVNLETLLTPTILKHSKNVILLNSENLTLKFDENINPKNANTLLFKLENWYKNGFLKAHKSKSLNIYQQKKKYRKAIMESVKKGVFDKIIFKTEHLMIVDFNEDYCRIVYGNESYLTVSGDELIPLYISFWHELVLIGNCAKANLENHSETVLYDFVKCLGTESSKHSDLRLDSKMEAKLVAMDNTDNPKLGFKVKTVKGLQIISPEMALTIFLQKIIGIFENFTNQEVTKVELRHFGSKLSPAQISALKFVESMLKKEVIYLPK